MIHLDDWVTTTRKLTDPHNTTILWSVNGDRLICCWGGGVWYYYEAVEQSIPETPERIALWIALKLLS